GCLPSPVGRKISARRTTPSSIEIGTSQSICIPSRTSVLVPCTRAYTLIYPNATIIGDDDASPRQDWWNRPPCRFLAPSFFSRDRKLSASFCRCSGSRSLHFRHLEVRQDLRDWCRKRSDLPNSWS